jgi:hypothetical protein
MASSLASQLPQGECVYTISVITINHCGSWLASDGGISNALTFGSFTGDVRLPVNPTP